MLRGLHGDGRRVDAQMSEPRRTHLHQERRHRLDAAPPIVQTALDEVRAGILQIERCHARNSIAR
jgi:hypothetical protein